MFAHITKMLKPRNCVVDRPGRSTIRTSGKISQGCYGCSCAKRSHTFVPGQQNPVWSTVTPRTTFTCVLEQDENRWSRPLPPDAPLCGPPPPKQKIPAYWTGACGYNNLVRSRRMGFSTSGATQRALVAAAFTNT
jgi:hypothetical protein